jgi:K+-transporting ATPase ATPase A chain
MTALGLVQIALFVFVLVLLTKPVGGYMMQVMEGDGGVIARFARPIELFIYRLFGVDPDEEMRWTEYTMAVLWFSLAGTLLTYILLRLQGAFPFNPMGFSTASAPAYATALTPDLVFNTAVSFCTNTNWQAYSGENTMSYFSQMVALAPHNWTSAAVGMAVCVALLRAFSRHSMGTLGNFWRDLTRSLLYIFFPASLLLALFFVSQGVIQNFDTYTTAVGVEGVKQIIPQGPVASQEAIKLLGINGGGIFNANSAHPYENPTAFCDFVEMLAIFIIPAGLTYMFGLAVKDKRQGLALLAVMFILFIAGTLICYHFEAAGNPMISAQHVETSTRVLGDLGGNMEGKEVRFGLAHSALFATITTDASCGAVNAMHDSFTPMGGFIPLLNMQLGEVIFGGVGSGLYGMLIFAILTVFVAGLMVGRTPEYVGKKIEQKEVKMAMLFVLAGCFSILVSTAFGAVTELPAQAYLNAPGATYNNVNNGGPHGFSEILYAFASCTGNNGSAFGGLTGNTPFYNIVCALAMLMGRFLMIIPVMALAGCLVQKKYVPPTSGTFPTHSILFVLLLIGIILIVGALTFFPALTLGPIVEHFLMHSHKLF